MQPLKIIIALLFLITLGIVVGSNLFPTITVIVLSQPTATFPVGVWLAISIGLGLLSSSAIQLILFLHRRALTKRLRQLQTRLQDRDEDTFVYTSSTPLDRPTENIPNSSFRQDIDRDQGFVRADADPQTIRNQSPNRANNFTSSPSAKPIIIEDDDWDKPEVKRQLEWDDVPQSINAREDRAYSSPRSQSRDETKLDDAVYDADFRLIQPPYKEPSVVEFEDNDEYLEIDEDEEEDLQPSSSTNPRNSPAEDWGFDFDDEAADLQSSKSNRRKL
jgi:hypothetical protein